jgi:hypothetical protein
MVIAVRKILGVHLVDQPVLYRCQQRTHQVVRLCINSDGAFIKRDNHKSLLLLRYCLE